MTSIPVTGIPMTGIPMTGIAQDCAETPFPHPPTPVAVQILGVLLFGGFAIVTTVLAFVFFWPAGFALAIILAWFGFGPLLHPRQARRADRTQASPALAPARPEPTGNASFDAYRAEVLTRLEEEQKTFVSFLERLRDAKDKSEFDTFMDDRARNAQAPASESNPAN